MSKYAGEEILVVKRALFDQLGDFQGIDNRIDHYLPTFLNPENNFFIDRASAEEDPSHKQIIPYAIFRCGNDYLHYTRGKSGGESRLHAKGSIGIGGHINPVDSREDHLGEATYMAGVERELEEELVIKSSYTQRTVALLNDDSNDVGKVHLGVVHIFELDGKEVTAGEDALANLQFISKEQLKGEFYEHLETWSQLCVDALDNL